MFKCLSYIKGYKGQHVPSLTLAVSVMVIGGVWYRVGQVWVGLNSYSR